MARENGVYSNSVEPCWCQRGIEDRLSPNTDGDGSEAEQSSSTTFPRRRRRSSSTTMRRSSPSSSSFFAKFSPFDTTASSSSSGRGSSSRRSRSSTSPSRTSFFAWLVVLLLLVDSVAGCGPGRRAGRRRRPRKLTPLVFKQHVPNVSENTLAASGLTEGRVTRGSKRFEELVPNYNPDIIFKDEEGTGADRFMTPRCKEKLNTLAISVMNQWPDVKLRVTEGWDEEGYHAPNSLHYEGRAVDIATSDRDRSKYGMLARLAVEAGFDWVYYESRSHIHCSVKSESSQGKSGGCFPGTSHVTTPTGHKRLADLSIGDSVLTMTREGSLVYRPVLMFLDVNREAGRTFVELTTTSGRKMFLTPSHLVYVVSNDGDEIERNGLFDGRVPFEKHADDALDTNEIDVNPKFAKTTTSSSSAPRSAQAIFARDVKPGMSVLVAATASSSHVESEVVISAQPVLKTDGFFAPLTSEGTVVVDDVVASCYAVLEDQYLAHWAFWPVRSYYRVKNWLFPTTVNSAEAKSSSTVVDHRGIHWYAKALYSLAQYVLPEKMLYDRS